MKTKRIEGKNKVIYQIFPRSFKDSNNDGNGDIKGITSKMDYLSDLGIDAIGLCPVYDTDFKDAGYDVKDYKKIGETFGTLNDFKEMVKEAKKRNIDIIMDIVLNHVSEEHEGFVKALESTENKEHNYFIGRDELTKDDKDAESFFGGSAWEFVPSLNKYYFHMFSKAQIDLNGDNEETVKAMADIVDFGYKLGVKGFRLDAIKHISKDFPKGIKTGYSGGNTAVGNLQKFNEIAFKDRDDAFVFGESSGITVKEMVEYGQGPKKVSSNFYNFSGGAMGGGETGRNGYNPDGDYKDFIKGMKPFQESKLVAPDMMTNFLSNHDTSRAVSRGGDENIYGKESAKSLALMMFGMKGIPSIYYGEEIGMLNPRFETRKDFRDVDALNSYKIYVDDKDTKIYSEEEMTKYHNINGRDNCRTPMQWDDTKNSGFNKSKEPGIKVGKTFKDINVEKQLKDKTSILAFYKEIISIRKSKKYGGTLVSGTANIKVMKNGLFKITREYENKTILLFVNVRDTNKEYEVPKGYEQVISSYSDNKEVNTKLRSYESIMFYKA